MTNGMIKGKNFERAVAHALSAWSGVELVRTPMSGAWIGRKADIWPKDTQIDFPLAVECKKAENWRMEQLLDRVGPVMDWIGQAERQGIEMYASTGRKYLPMLIFSRNRCASYVAVRADGCGICASAYILLAVEGVPYTIARLVDFLALNPYAAYISVALSNYHPSDDIR